MNHHKHYALAFFISALFQSGKIFFSLSHLFYFDRLDGLKEENKNIKYIIYIGCALERDET